MRILGAGHLAFAVTWIALGILGFVLGDFTPVWKPVAPDTPARAGLVYICAAVALTGGAGLLWRRTAAVAARLLLGYLLAWLAVFRLLPVVRSPATQDPWSGLGEAMVYAAGAWALYAAFALDADRRRLPFAVGPSGQRIARVLYGLALIPFGIAHFSYAKETAALVPGWLPAHDFFVYFTACAFLAAAAALLTGVGARLAAYLSAAQMGLFTLLVWAPMMTRAPNAFQWSEFGISVALTTAAWAVADSCRAAPSFAAAAATS